MTHLCRYAGGLVMSCNLGMPVWWWWWVPGLVFVLNGGWFMIRLIDFNRNANASTSGLVIHEGINIEWIGMKPCLLAVLLRLDSLQWNWWWLNDDESSGNSECVWMWGDFLSSFPCPRLAASHAYKEREFFFPLIGLESEGRLDFFFSWNPMIKQRSFEWWDGMVEYFFQRKHLLIPVDLEAFSNPGFFSPKIEERQCIDSNDCNNERKLRDSGQSLEWLSHHHYHGRRFQINEDVYVHTNNNNKENNWIM